MRVAIPLIIMSLFMLPAQRAHGESKDKCNGAEGIAPQLLDACNQGAYDRCRPSYQQRCVDGIIKSFQQQTKELGKAAERKQEASAELVCDTDAFTAECTKANAYAKDVCNASGTPAGQKTAEGLAKWLALFAKAPEAKAYWAAFAPKYPQCQLSKFKCSYSDFDRQACDKIEDTFRAKWIEYRNDLAHNVDLGKEDVATLAKNPFDWGAAARLDELAKHLEDAGKFAVSAYLNVDTKELQSWSAWLAGEKAKWLANRDAALDKVRCPAATNNDKTLTTTLRAVLDEHGKALKDPNSKMVETVATFGLTGKAVQSYEALPPITHEDQGGFACVKQEKEGKTTCRVLKVTFRRSKPGSSKFGTWGFYSVGGGDEMSCKNLK